jgi:PAS domain S-box-containing protein
MLLVGTVLSRWAIVLTALLCTVLADLFDPFAFTLSVGLPQDILVLTSLAAAGLYSYEVARNREREKHHLMTVELEASARRIAEEQLEFLIESSPAAILTMDDAHLIVRANPAAYRLFGVPAGQLTGKSIRRYLPALGRVELVGMALQTFRTEMQCRGEREHGEAFLADVFFSTYDTALGPRLAALVLDASEEMRAREELGLEQLLTASRILVGAVSHEVRNVCGAISVIYENLLRHGRANGDKDFEALGSMVETLQKIAALELKQNAGPPQLSSMDLVETLSDLRIVLNPYCQEAGVSVKWEIPPNLPRVWADRHRLLQVLLNLTKNSKRALESSEIKEIHIGASLEKDRVLIHIRDSGPGIQFAERLFQPFQQGANATGLGLYLSRALMHSIRGDLRHEPGEPGCCFAIELAVVKFIENDIAGIEGHANKTPGC